MEKVKLSSFQLAAPTTKSINIGETVFTVRRSIPYEDLLTHVQWAIMLIIDDKGYISEPVRIVIRELVLVAAFSNIDLSRLELSSITQHEVYEIYDIVKKTGIYAATVEFVSAEQLNFFNSTLDATLQSILNYRNSIAGMVELLSVKSETLKEQLSTVLEDFQDDEKIGNILKVAEAMRLDANRPTT
jgi:hypothetical protein